MLTLLTGDFMKASRYRHLIGIDVGFANTGIVVFDTKSKKFVYSATVTTKQDKKRSTVVDIYQRIHETMSVLYRLTKQFPTSHIVAEMPTGGGQGAIPLRAMAAATGAIAAFMSCQNLTLNMVTPTQTKRLVKPKGKVSKEEVQEYVEERLSRFDFFYSSDTKAIKEHIADAAAALLACPITAKYFK